MATAPRGAIGGIARIVVGRPTTASGRSASPIVGRTPWQDIAFPSSDNRGEMNPVGVVNVFGRTDQGEGPMADDLPVSTRCLSWSGCDSFNLAALDRVFADSKPSLGLEGSLFQEFSSLEGQW